VPAPFSGTIASVPVQKGDNVSSGTTVATIITSQQVATISLNEVDIAKIQLGQKATLTFDAVADLKITGKVAQIDSIGTVSQGVVNYNVKISFDTTDERIKPGMSVSAAIITNIKQDVLIAPNSAVKNQNGSAYVEMFDNALPAPLAGVQGSPSATPPRQQDVTVGISNDTSTEIISGIKEGDEIVTKTILPTTTTMTAPSIFGSATNRSGANATRIGTGR
jgi:HlyD family secretion protein